jgi:hypothetical protein
MALPPPSDEGARLSKRLAGRAVDFYPHSLD